MFHPERIANRILGMGDIVSLVEKAAQDLGEENIKQAEENLKKGQFSMEDYLTQLRQMKKMGGIEGNNVILCLVCQKLNPKWILLELMKASLQKMKQLFYQ